MTMPQDGSEKNQPEKNRPEPDGRDISTDSEQPNPNKRQKRSNQENEKVPDGQHPKKPVKKRNRPGKAMRNFMYQEKHIAWKLRLMNYHNFKLVNTPYCMPFLERLQKEDQVS
jgi:hypothetical protein